MVTTTLQGPLRVYGRRGDAQEVALVIARSLTGAQVKRVRSAWLVTLGGRKGVFRQEPPNLMVEVDGAGFDAGHSEARQAVHQDLVRSVRGSGLDGVLAAIPNLRIGISFSPLDPEQLRPTGPLAHLALDVSARVDGFVLDLHNGRLVSITGEVLGTTERLLAEGATPVDPSLTRIRGRLVALLAVAARALTEYDGRDLEEARDGIARWVRSVGVTNELEPHELAFLERPAREFDDAELAYGSWQVEGATVLAWALDLIDELPAQDEAADPTYLSGLLCFPDAAKTLAVLNLGRRRFQAGVEAEAARHRAIHSQLSAAAGETADAAGADVTLSITTERLRACRWLISGGTYSSTGL